jgi:hypothetical protein
MTCATTLVVGHRHRSSPAGWLTFALIRPTIPPWIAAASC